LYIYPISKLNLFVRSAQDCDSSAAQGFLAIF
jgi:hypothetical protein